MVLGKTHITTWTMHYKGITNPMDIIFWTFFRVAKQWYYKLSVQRQTEICRQPCVAQRVEHQTTMSWEELTIRLRKAAATLQVWTIILFNFITKSQQLNLLCLIWSLSAAKENNWMFGLLDFLDFLAVHVFTSVYLCGIMQGDTTMFDLVRWKQLPMALCWGFNESVETQCCLCANLEPKT